MLKPRRPEPKRFSIEVPADFPLPPKTQWGYTPALWEHSLGQETSGNVLTGTEIAPRVNLHHDAEQTDIAIRGNGAEGGLSFSITKFSGSFLSLAFGFPVDVAKAIRRHDLIRIAVTSEAAEPFKAYARLNLRHGPNNEQIVRMIDIGHGDSFAEFDIFYSEFEPNRSSDAWIDLIFNNPEGLAFTLSQAVILRRVRATL